MCPAALSPANQVSLPDVVFDVLSALAINEHVVLAPVVAPSVYQFPHQVIPAGGYWFYPAEVAFLSAAGMSASRHADRPTALIAQRSHSGNK